MKKNFSVMKVVAGVFVIYAVLLNAPRFVLADTATFKVQADGWNEAGGVDWEIVRNASIAGSAINDNSIYAADKTGAVKWFGNYYINRLQLIFDTSSLPDNAIIDTATVMLTPFDGTYTASSTGVYVVQTNIAGSETTLESYGLVGDVDFGHIMIPAAGQYAIDLNQNGTSTISKIGSTKFALRSWHDFNDVIPVAEVGTGLDGDDLYIASLEADPDHAPALIVNYHLPTTLPPTADCKKGGPNNQALKNILCEAAKPVGQAVQALMKQLHK